MNRQARAASINSKRAECADYSRSRIKHTFTALPENFATNQIEYGHIGADTGYLRIVSFGGYSKQGDFATGLMALQSALDEIFSDSALRALVIDVRVNFGGDDPYGLEIASRLTTAITSRTRNKPALSRLITINGPLVIRALFGRVRALVFVDRSSSSRARSPLALARPSLRH